MELKHRRSWAANGNQKLIFFLLTSFDTITSVMASHAIIRHQESKTSSRNSLTKGIVNFRLPFVAHGRLCLSSLLITHFLHMLLSAMNECLGWLVGTFTRSGKCSCETRTGDIKSNETKKSQMKQEEQTIIHFGRFLIHSCRTCKNWLMV